MTTTLKTGHVPNPDRKVAASEEADGLPVPIVPGPVSSRPRPRPHAPQPAVEFMLPPHRLPPSRHLPPASRRQPLGGANGYRADFSATEERAVADARHQLRDRITHWLDPEVPAVVVASCPVGRCL